jgi:hypothetical protein
MSIARSSAVRLFLLDAAGVNRWIPVESNG